MTKNFFRMLLVIATFVVLPVFGSVLAQDEDLTIAENVVELAEADDAEFTVLLELLVAADLVDAVADEDAELTVFAPTDEAFEDLLEELNVELDDLLEDIALIEQVLLYHVVDGIAASNDLSDGDEIETLQGGTIEVAIEDDTVTLNGSAEVIIADILTSNGVIHVIDAVLISQIGASSGEACTVSSEEFNGASVHVGPGNNRTAVTFLETDVDYEVLGQNEDANGVIWYQLDREEAAPGRAINEAWVSSEEVDTEGDCDSVGESSAPPIIPIVQAAPTQSPDTSGETSEDTTEAPADASSAIVPSPGTWTFSYSSITNGSCEGGSNVQFTTDEVYGTTPSFSDPLTLTATGFSFDGISFVDIGNNTYQGVFTVEGITGTLFITANSTTNMTGRLIASFSGCSFTTNVTMTR